MKRLMMLFVAGILLVPALTIASGFHNPLDQTIQLQGFTSGPSTSGHNGVDLDADQGDAVYAIADGTVFYYSSSADGYGGGGAGSCPAEDGTVLFIRHRKSDGMYFVAQYGHIQNVPASLHYTGRDGNGPTVNWGQMVAEIGEFAPCRTSPCEGTRCDHLHFGWWDSENNIPNNQWGYGPACFAGGCWINPLTGMSTYSPYGGAGEPFAALKTGQSGSVTPWLPPNGTISLYVDYQNIGTATWESSGGVSNPNHVELRSVDGSCSLVNGCAYHSSWTNAQRIEAATQPSVAPGVTAHFQFITKAGTSTGSCEQWVAPWSADGCMQGWGGVNFTVLTDATPPTQPVASVTPTTNNVNSFTFDWTISTDAHSGFYRYGYSLNGNGPTYTTSTSVAGAGTTQGTNTLVVYAYDNVGNVVASAPVTFTLTSSPCPGREIVGCVPPASCYPASMIATLPDPTYEQMVIGQPVGEAIKPNEKYSIGFEYRAETDSDVQLGLGTLNPTAKLGVVFNQVTLPTGNGDWRPFWSAPFTVTAEQLSTFTNLRFLTSKTSGIEIRGIKILKYPDSGQTK